MSLTLSSSALVATSCAESSQAYVRLHHAIVRSSSPYHRAPFTRRCTKQ